MEITKRYNVFLDDERNPEMAYGYTHDLDYVTPSFKWIVVRNYDDFVKLVTDRFKKGEFPNIVSFDHDLADIHYKDANSEVIPYDTYTEKTGYHVAKWLVDFCIDNKLKLPKYKLHSMNEVGRQNILSYLENAKKHTNI